MNKCPYCGGSVTPPKVKKWETPCFAHGQCTECPRKPRAKVSWGKDGNMYISYKRDGRKPLPDDERKDPFTFRLSKRDREQGCTLTIKGKSFILKPCTDTV